MGKCLVTGSEGFIGRNLCLALSERNIPFIAFDKENSLEDLESSLKDISLIYHLAGINRSKEEKEFFDGNYGLTKRLIEKIEKKSLKIPLVYSSSVQAELDNPYGKSKRLAEEEIMKYSERNNIPVFIYRLPNVFGKWSRPNYNSVVATFCHNVARGIPLKISDENKEISLVYINEIIGEFVRHIERNEKERYERIINFDKIHKINLGDLADKIRSFEDMRKKIHVPKFTDSLTKYLYSTYLSYLPEESFAVPLLSHEDHRGSFTEFVKTSDSGQFSISITKSGENITRGNHYHHTKTERFFVVKGKASVKFRNLLDNKMVEYIVSEKEPKAIDIPPGYTHNITNIGEDEMILLIWANEKFDPKSPDTYFESV
jgi:UDP-2-acetamido-2,6-beta-L-arabino-hexul-4-ose reductase